MNNPGQTPGDAELVLRFFDCHAPSFDELYNYRSQDIRRMLTVILGNRSNQGMVDVDDLVNDGFMLLWTQKYTVMEIKKLVTLVEAGHLNEARNASIKIITRNGLFDLDRKGNRKVFEEGLRILLLDSNSEIPDENLKLLTKEWCTEFTQRNGFFYPQNEAAVKSWLIMTSKRLMPKGGKNLTGDISLFVESDDQDQIREYGSVDPTQKDLTYAAEIASVINEAMDSLPEKQRQAVEMVDISNIPAKEVAELLEINYSTLRRNLSEGRQKIREIIIKHDIHPRLEG